MGKPPGVSKSSSSHRKMSVEMTSSKSHLKMKKKRSKTKARIQKLFDNLRNESLSSSTTSLENTIIERKRKLESPEENNNKKLKCENSVIVIADDSIAESFTPKKPHNKVMHCSTPINRKSEPDFIPIIMPKGVEEMKKKKRNSKCSTPTKQKSEPDFIPIVQHSTENDKNEVDNLNSEIQNLTKEINKDSYITIDLTTDTLNCSAISNPQNTVIDLDAHHEDCTIVSVSNHSMSGDSDVTVLNMGSKPNNKEKQLKKFVRGIAKLDASEKGRLLELITQNIFSGCNVGSSKVANSEVSKPMTSRAIETVEDTYIKEVILGEARSRNSIGSNIYNPERDQKNKQGLRMIVIDGSNVAMEHSRGRSFSVKGLKICIDYFLQRGHVVKAFVPRFRCKFGKSTDPRLLDELERQGLVIYTPSREIQGRLVTSYDDRYIVQCAAEFDGIIVSGDNYRDLLRENPRWRSVIETRLLPFTWVQDMIMFPKDPLGRNGPSLEQFLRHSA